MRTLLRVAVPCVLAVLSAGCLEEFTPAWLVTEARVAGARVEVEGDPDRAWPRPGEAATVRWRVVYPGEPRPLTWAFAWCPAAPVLFGQPFCVEGAEPMPAGVQLEPATAHPFAQIPVPEVGALGGAEELLLVGLICADGIPAFDPASIDDPSALSDACEGEAPVSLPVVLSIPLEVGLGSNAHPDFAAITLDGATWNPPPLEVEFAPQEGCDPAWGLPEVAAGSAERTLGFQVPAAARESFEVEGPGGGPVTEVEELQVAHLTNTRDLDRLFTFIEAEGQTSDEVPWEPPPPADVATDRQLVRFDFTMIDGRGGTTFALRALCLTR